MPLPRVNRRPTSTAPLRAAVVDGDGPPTQARTRQSPADRSHSEISDLAAVWALMAGLLLLSADAVVRADRVRAQIRRSLAAAFSQVDVVAWPATPAPSPPISDPVVELPSGRHPADFANVRLGGLGNLAGVPAASVPCGLTAGRLPIGLQLLAPWREEERLLDLAELLERATDRRFVDAAPPVAQPAAA